MRPKLPTCIPVEDDKNKKMLIMQERFSRCVDFKEKYLNEDKEDTFQIIPDYKVKLNYENFNTQETLQVLLPKDVEIIGGFEQVGDIAHLNLSDK